MKPAILGGRPIFSKILPIVKPPLERYAKKKFLYKIKNILDSGLVTNELYVKALEKEVQRYLKVKGAVALSSCTSGLILTLQLLGLKGKEVILPSFTFSATAAACYWNNCKIVFVDSDRETFNISIADLKKKISKSTSAIIGVHIFGNPCEVYPLAELAEEYNLKLIFDAAHALGASIGAKKIGSFGDAEVFSCSPTKLLITMEGGIVTSNNRDLSERLKISRNYGNNPDYTCRIPGLSSRMTEINALLGLEMLREIDEIVKNRNRYAQIYRRNLSKIAGIIFQKITPGSVHAYKDFAILIDSKKFGIDRDILFKALIEENIMVRKYFSPAVHQLNAFAKFINGPLPNTEYLAKNILCLPIYSYMDIKIIKNISLAIKRIHYFAKDIRVKKLKMG